jgi:hypothetical protein
MANTYTLIQTATVGSGGTSAIDFSSIPSTYTDLKLVFSIRTSRSGSAADAVALKINNVVTNQTSRNLYGDGSSALSVSGTEIQAILNGNSGTTNAFGSGEFYLPNYAGSTYKSVSVESVQENNFSGARTDMVAGLWSQTTAINQLSLYSVNSATILEFSLASLYGIKNS